VLVVSEIVWWSPDPMRVSVVIRVAVRWTVGKMVDGRGWSGVKVGLTEAEGGVPCQRRRCLKLGSPVRPGACCVEEVSALVKERGVQEGDTWPAGER